MSTHVLTDGCHYCEEIKILFEIPGNSTHKPHYLCDNCYSEYIKGYIMLVYCDNCTVEFVTEDVLDNGPYYCKGCEIILGKKDSDFEYEEAYSAYEKYGTGYSMHEHYPKDEDEDEVEEDPILSNSVITHLSVRRAIYDYVERVKKVEESQRNI